MQKKENEYKKSGVDVEAGYKAVELIKPYVEKTKTDEVIGNIGGFAGLFKPNFKNLKEPILVSSTDGVGTKIRLAMLLNKHNTIGIDCVAMCANDIICSGAEPLFFLDYIACGKNYPQKIADIVKGVSQGCIQAEMALIGGETAEHPNIMAENEYDLCGFAVGIVDRNKILPKNNIKPNDIIIGLPSSGVHSNGFSLIRKIFDIENIDLNDNFNFLENTLGNTLLTPTTIYVQPIKQLLKDVSVKAICHITGGGFFENIPRMLPNNMSAVIYKQNLKTPKIFELIMKKGDISENNMLEIFNMGVGLMCVIPKEEEEKALISLRKFNVNAYVLGKISQEDVKVKIV